MAMASKHRGYYIICMRVSGFMTKVETSRVHVSWLCPVPLQDGWLHPCHGLWYPIPSPSYKLDKVNTPLNSVSLDVSFLLPSLSVTHPVTRGHVGPYVASFPCASAHFSPPISFSQFLYFGLAPVPSLVEEKLLIHRRGNRQDTTLLSSSSSSRRISCVHLGSPSDCVGGCHWKWQLTGLRNLVWKVYRTGKLPSQVAP